LEARSFGFSQSTCVVLAKQLHAHDREYEDYNAQDEGQIAQGADSAAHNRYEQIQCRPGFGQLENTQLQIGRAKERKGVYIIEHEYEFELITIAALARGSRKNMLFKTCWG